MGIIGFKLPTWALSDNAQRLFGTTLFHVEMLILLLFGRVRIKRWNWAPVRS